MTAREAPCPHCARLIQFEQYHAGFGDEGYLYCDKDSTVLTWSSYDRVYSSIVRKHPWMLTDAEKRLVEDALLPCPLGGKFAFSNSPRCPHCSQEIRSLVPDAIHYIVVGRNVTPKDAPVWRGLTDRR